MFSDQFSFPSMPLAADNKYIIPGNAVPSLSFVCTTQTPQMPPNSNTPQKPKRPLSAYNLFFKHERQKLMEESPVRPEGKHRGSNGKIGFASLARIIADRWKNIDDETRDYFEDLAAEDKARYKQEKKAWKKASEAAKIPEKVRPAQIPEKASPNAKNNKQLASMLQGVLDDTLQDVDSFNSIQATRCGSSNTQCQSIQEQTVLKSKTKIPSLSSELSVKETGSKVEANGLLSVLQGLNNYSGSLLLDEKTMQKKGPSKLMESISIPFVDRGVEGEMKHSCATQIVAPQAGKALDVSKLAAALDDECIAFLCGW